MYSFNLFLQQIVIEYFIGVLEVEGIAAHRTDKILPSWSLDSIGEIIHKLCLCVCTYTHIYTYTYICQVTINFMKNYFMDSEVKGGAMLHKWSGKTTLKWILLSRYLI